MSEQSASGTERSWANDIHQGDAVKTLAEIPESSVHCAMTSPPYFGLRDYGVDGQIGLEDSLDEYIDELVGVGRELRRVLRDDGSWWLNLGDSFAGSGGAGGQWTSESSGSAEYDGDAADAYNGPLNESGIGRKNKMLVPHRVAIALQRDGWVVRNDVTWVKPNPMPHSVKDRLNTATEQIFHLVPQPDYWYDLDAIREPHADRSVQRATRDDNRHEHSERQSVAQEETLNPKQFVHPAGKNPGDVFKVTTKPFPDAHFAVYPPELCEKPIKATCPPKVCVECGAPYDRIVDVERENYGNRDDRVQATGGAIDGGVGKNFPDTKREFKGWRQTCDCGAEATEAGICLDPFAGAGTTLLKAKELGRRFVGVELNPEYADMARARVGLSPEDPSNVRDDDQQQGFEAYTDGGRQ